MFAPRVHACTGRGGDQRPHQFAAFRAVAHRVGQRTCDAFHHEMSSIAAHRDSGSKGLEQRPGLVGWIGFAGCGPAAAMRRPVAPNMVCRAGGSSLSASVATSAASAGGYAAEKAASALLVMR